MNIRQRSHGLIRTNTNNNSSNNNASNFTSVLSLQTTKLNSTCSENDHNERNEYYNGKKLKQLNSSNHNRLRASRNFRKSSSALTLARDRRAAKNLFILVFAFVLCWCPYTLLTLIRALCNQPDRCISLLLYEITFWLLWLNSTVNPLLYSFLHVKFRTAFYRILCFYSVRHHRRLSGYRT